MATRAQALSIREGIASYATGLVSEQSKEGLNGDAMWLTGEPVPCSTNFEYGVFNDDVATDIPDTATGENDPEGALLTYGGTKVQGTLITNTATTDWFPTGQDVKDADLLLDLQQGAKIGTARCLLGRLNTVLTAVNASAGTATIDASDAAVDVVNKLQVEIETVEKASGGYCDINLLWGASAYRAIVNHAKVQSRITGGSTKGAPSTIKTVEPEALDAIIGYGTKSRRSRAVYNSANAGQTATNAYLITNTVYVCAVSRIPNRMDPAAVKIFQGRAGNGMLMDPTYWTHNNRLCEKATWRWRELTKVTHAAGVRKIAITLPS